MPPPDPDAPSSPSRSLCGERFHGDCRSDPAFLCGTCRHWGSDHERSANEPIRYCLKIEDIDSAELAPDRMAGTGYNDCSATYLRCRAEFGCVLHEPLPPVQGSLVEAIEALRNAGGDAWDEIDDPRAFLDEVTGG